MLYRDFGRTGIKMSSLGFGAMRLPMMKADGKSVVDEEKAMSLVDKVLEAGVNYFDTAPGYCDAQSEAFLGKALKGRRDKVYLSTKNPVSDDSYDNYMKKLEDSLKRLDTDYIDFYHFWGIGLEQFNNMINKKGGPIDAALDAKKQGLIKHISFSYHDKPENMKPIIDTGYFSSVLMQYNLIDRANEKNIDYAHEKGLGVVIMGPVGGGMLAAESAVISGLLNGKTKSSAETALRFVLSNPHVSVALSGMKTIEMALENADIASVSGHLSKAEQESVKAIMDERKRLADLYCTGCRYCMPCPQHVSIPWIFELMNSHRVYGLTDFAKTEYANIPETPWEKSNDATQCIECGACESKCPQHLEIIKQLKECHKVLAQG